MIEVLSKLISDRGALSYLHRGNAPEFVRTALLKWVVERGIEPALIDPGKPWKNGTNENVDRKFCDECVAMEWFRNRLEAKFVNEDWRRLKNEVEPNPSLKHQTPVEFSRQQKKEPSMGPAQINLVRKNRAVQLLVMSMYRSENECYKNL